ncbi:MAG: hypothetical protein WBL74_14390 [Novosphingobium sp.]|uniref:hypothetical protein n=1 Tax=Novosphingobium sp. TaxID=1874826 RepID=UPI003C7A045E
MKRFATFLSVGLALAAPSTMQAKNSPSKPVVEHIDLDKLDVEFELVCYKQDTDPPGPAITSFFVHHIVGETSTKRFVELSFYNKDLPPNFVLTNPIQRADHILGSGLGTYVLVGRGPANSLDRKLVSEKVSFKLVISYTPENYLRADLTVTSKEVSLKRKGCHKAPPRPISMEPKQ